MIKQVSYEQRVKDIQQLTVESWFVGEYLDIDEIITYVELNKNQRRYIDECVEYNVKEAMYYVLYGWECTKSLWE